MTAIAPESINFSVLPSVPFSARRKLPHCPAIYFVLESDRVIYIGQTNSLLLRWQTHHKCKELKDRGTQLNIAWIEFNNKELLCEIEQALINWFKPELNASSFPLKPKATNDGTKMYCRLAVLMAEKDPQLSQRQLARETGLDITTINRLFTNNFNRVDTNTIEVLCNYFGRNVGDLLEMRDPKDIPKRKTRKRNKGLQHSEQSDLASEEQNLVETKDFA